MIQTPDQSVDINGDGFDRVNDLNNEDHDNGHEDLIIRVMTMKTMRDMFRKTQLMGKAQIVSQYFQQFFISGSERNPDHWVSQRMMK
jgi:hypothetical protein